MLYIIYHTNHTLAWGRMSILIRTIQGYQYTVDQSPLFVSLLDTLRSNEHYRYGHRLADVVGHAAQHFADFKTRGADSGHNYQIYLVFVYKVADILCRLSCLDLRSYFYFCTLWLALSDVALHGLSQPVKISDSSEPSSGSNILSNIFVTPEIHLLKIKQSLLYNYCEQGHGLLG